MLNEDDFDRIKSGDVLVCRTTTPTWNVVFGTVGAMVAEVGIVVSHVAIVAREFRLPAGVNVRNAPTTLRDGMHVEIDGTRGIMRY
ncbi:MAG TPA: PEP-utilizing enzyme [Dehalococcoidia bacterium]